MQNKRVRILVLLCLFVFLVGGSGCLTYEHGRSSYCTYTCCDEDECTDYVDVPCDNKSCHCPVGRREGRCEVRTVLNESWE